MTKASVTSHLYYYIIGLSHLTVQQELLKDIFSVLTPDDWLTGRMSLLSLIMAPCTSHMT